MTIAHHSHKGCYVSMLLQSKTRRCFLQKLAGIHIYTSQRFVSCREIGNISDGHQLLLYEYLRTQYVSIFLSSKCILYLTQFSFTPSQQLNRQCHTRSFSGFIYIASCFRVILQCTFRNAIALHPTARKSY